MKNFRILVLCLALFSCSSLFAQKFALIEFEKDTNNYGNARYGGDGSCLFKFKNTGKDPLVIQKVLGHGCIPVAWPEDEILPGAVGYISARYDMKRAGSIRKNITVYSNAINAPVKELYLRGEVMQVVEENLPDPGKYQNTNR